MYSVLPVERLDNSFDSLTRCAADEKGVSYDTMQRKVGTDFPNVGRRYAPRVRRCDLYGGGGPHGPDLVGAVLRDSGRGGDIEMSRKSETATDLAIGNNGRMSGCVTLKYSEFWH